MLPPGHVGVSTIPREELDLWGLCKRARSKSESFTMRAFLLSGPSDIQLRAPGISRDLVGGFEGILNVQLTLSLNVSAGVRAPPAVAVLAISFALWSIDSLPLRALQHHYPLLATCARSWGVEVHQINGPL